ncbi:MAG TPA: hypothetical protein VIJ01_16920 [Candidatus Angelobacter sp.]
MQTTRLIAFLLLLALVAVRPAKAKPRSDAQKIDVQEIVRQAVINFNTRESLPRDYTYLENLKVDHPDRKNGYATDTFEVIEIKGHPFRRHVAHNGEKIAEEKSLEDDEESRAKLAEVDHRILEEEIKPGQTKESLAAAVQKIMDEAGLKDWKPQLFSPPPIPSMGVVTFGQTLYQFKLPLQDLNQKFHLKFKGEHILDGRNTYVVQADPRHTKDEADPAGNFRIKVWIDQQETQIVKVEGKAIRSGPLANAEYAAFSSKVLSKEEIAERKKQLEASQLFYGDDTVITEQWTKVNNEAWLLTRRHVKGFHVFIVQGQRHYFRSNFSLPVEYDTVDTNYKKFHVGHRILPAQ